jgi:mannosyltransferase
MAALLKSPSAVLDSIIFGLQQNGGISNYWARLLDAYVSNAAMNAELIMPRDIRFRGFKNEWLNRFEVHQESISPRVSLYLRVRSSGGCEVFHTSYYRIPAGRTRRYVVTAYDFMYERYRKGPARWVHTLQKRRSLERADVISCISTFTRNEVLDFFPHIDPARLQVVPLGVDTDSFYPDRRDEDADLAHTVLFVGLRYGYKRFDLAVEAVRASRLSLVLGIVGPALSDRDRAQLDAALGDRWQYFGAVSVDRLRELFSSAYALLFPSDCEGFGLPILEAMACHCPVVAANRASLPEVGGDAALYAPDQRADDFAEALDSLGSGNLRQRLISSGDARVSQFTWAHTCRKTQELYQLAI